MKKLLISIFLIMICNFAYSQDAHIIDSLKQVIATIEKACPEPCDADTARINAYIKIGMKVEKQNPDSAFVLYKKGSEYANRFLSTSSQRNTHVVTTTKKHLALGLYNIGYYYLMKSEIDSALNYFEKCKVILEELNDDKNLMTNLLFCIGYINNIQGETLKALETFKKCLNIYKELGDKRGMAVSFNNIGSMYKNQGFITKAIECDKKSLNIYEEIGEKKGIAMSLYHLGRISRMQNNFKLFEEYITRVYTISKGLGYSEYIERAS